MSRAASLPSCRADPARAASISAPKRSSSIASKAASRENQSLRASPKVGRIGAPNQQSRTARASAACGCATRSTIAVAHPVGGLEERLHQPQAQRLVDADIVHRPRHAAATGRVPRCRSRTACGACAGADGRSADVVSGPPIQPHRNKNSCSRAWSSVGGCNGAQHGELAARGPSNHKTGRPCRARAFRRRSVRRPSAVPWTLRRSQSAHTPITQDRVEKLTHLAAIAARAARQHMPQTEPAAHARAGDARQQCPPATATD